MAAARTGSANNSMKAVTRMAQTNSGILWSVMPGARMFKMVVMKLMAPRMEDAPARCIESITMSTAGPGEPLVESGGTSVQHVPAPKPDPPGTRVEPINRRHAGTSNQQEVLFKIGKGSGRKK